MVDILESDIIKVLQHSTLIVNFGQIRLFRPFGFRHVCQSFLTPSWPRAFSRGGTSILSPIHPSPRYLPPLPLLQNTDPKAQSPFQINSPWVHMYWRQGLHQRYTTSKCHSYQVPQKPPYKGRNPVQSEDAIRGKSLFSRPLKAPGPLTDLRPAGATLRLVTMTTLF